MSTTEDYQAEVRALRAQLAELRGTLQSVPEPGPAKRLTLSEILEAHLETMKTRATGGSSSVTLKENTHKTVQIEVTVRTGESDDTHTVDDCAAKARTVFDLLRTFYPPEPVDPKGAK